MSDFQTVQYTNPKARYITDLTDTEIEHQRQQWEEFLAKHQNEANSMMLVLFPARLRFNDANTWWEQRVAVIPQIDPAEWTGKPFADLRRHFESGENSPEVPEDRIRFGIRPVSASPPSGALARIFHWGDDRTHCPDEYEWIGPIHWPVKLSYKDLQRMDVEKMPWELVEVARDDPPTNDELEKEPPLITCLGEELGVTYVRKDALG